MATVKIHGSPISAATMRVLTVAYEKDLDFEFVLVDLAAGAHKQPAFLALNPFGQVPAFEDGDLKLFESRAITRYLAYEYENKGTQLLFKDRKQMATMSVWAEVEAHQFDTVAGKLTWEFVYKKMLGMETDKAAVEENEAKLAKVLDVYETRLSQSKYLGGEAFSLVDVHHLPNLHFLMDTQSKKLFEDRPHVNAWCKDILARPAWAKVVAMQKH